jgi:hypothetical protein
LLHYGLALGLCGLGDGELTSVKITSASSATEKEAGLGLNLDCSFFLGRRAFFCGAIFFLREIAFFFDAALRFFAIMGQLGGLPLSFHGYGKFPPDPERQLI